jgi:hypothetical protein
MALLRTHPKMGMTLSHKIKILKMADNKTK